MESGIEIELTESISDDNKKRRTRTPASAPIHYHLKKLREEKIINKNYISINGGRAYY